MSAINLLALTNGCAEAARASAPPSLREQEAAVSPVIRLAERQTLEVTP
jgi:hypothetical protein